VSKNPKSAQFAQSGKKPKQFDFKQFTDDLKKQPKVASDPQAYYHRSPSWRFTRAEMVDPFGWHEITNDELHDVRVKLIEFERRTWAEILVADEANNHGIKTYKLCLEARQRLKELNIAVDEVHSLRLTAKNRVFGIMDNGVFEVLWWDPEHQICPVRK
jgi:hypothetical protein